MPKEPTDERSDRLAPGSESGAVPHAAVPPEVLLASIVQFCDDAIITKDLAGTVTSWNPAAERIFGYPAEEMIGRPISVIIPPERGAEEFDILQRISRGERIDHYHTVRLRKDGKPIDVSVTISPLVHQGRIIGASNISRDITEQKQTERLIEDERARLEVTLSSIGDGVIVTDMNGMVCFMNPVAQAMTGWTLESSRGQPIELVFSIVNETTRRRGENPVARALREGAIVGLANHTLLLSKTGVEYAIDDSAAPIRDRSNQVIGVVLVFRDVSGERAAEGYMSRLAAIVESSDDAIISKDLTGRITSWNSAAQRLFGYTAAEAIGRPISMLIPPDRLHEETTILDSIRRGERVEHFETVRITKNRRKLDVSLTISPLLDSEGRVVGASKIARDITQRKKTERELAAAREQVQRHSAELERTVVERTAELRQAIEQLESFSYSVSHDLRAPLRTIRSFAQIVRQDYASALPPDGRQMLERMEVSATRLCRLIDDVLESAKRKLTARDLTRSDLAALVPKIIEDFPNLREHRQAMHIREPLLPVLGVEALIVQCVSNLLANAVKFASPARPLRIDIFTERLGDKIRLHIRDNGVGISESDRAKLFHSFSGGANAAGAEAAGFGLVLTKRAARQMGGDVGLMSAPDAGSDFWIELAAAD